MLATVDVPAHYVPCRTLSPGGASKLHYARLVPVASLNPPPPSSPPARRRARAAALGRRWQKRGALDPRRQVHRARAPLRASNGTGQPDLVGPDERPGRARRAGVRARRRCFHASARRRGSSAPARATRGVHGWGDVVFCTHVLDGVSPVPLPLPRPAGRPPARTPHRARRQTPRRWRRARGRARSRARRVWGCGAVAATRRIPPRAPSSAAPRAAAAALALPPCAPPACRTRADACSDCYKRPADQCGARPIRAPSLTHAARRVRARGARVGAEAAPLPSIASMAGCQQVPCAPASVRRGGAGS